MRCIKRVRPGGMWNCFAVDRRRSSAFSTQDGFAIDDGTVVPVTPMSTLVQQSMLMAAPQQLDGDLALQPPKIIHFNRYLSLPAGTGAQQNKARMILSFLLINNNNIFATALDFDFYFLPFAYLLFS